jgi:ribosomal-protein-alanine N-acetyltransferase
MNNAFIQGEGIYLRELQETDLEGSWYRWFNDHSVTVFQNKGIFPNTKEKQRQYFDSLGASQSDVVLAIIEESSAKHIGNVGLHRIDWVHRSAELGIVLGDKAAWGNKYGKQAWQLITDYGFQTLNLHRIYAQIMEGNIASCKSAEAAGFKKEGYIRDVFFKNGKYLNLYYYNRIDTDQGRAE